MSEAAPCLLIIDPDESFSAALAAEARNAGLRTICCRSWWDAKPVLEGSEPLAAMIVELALPAGTPNGVSAALMARRRRERLPVLFVSAEPALLVEVRPGTGATLAKTVGLRRLVECAAGLVEGEDAKPAGPVPHLVSSPRAVLNPKAHYRLDRTTRFRSVSDGALVLWRRTRADILGRPLLDVFPQMAGLPKFQAHLAVLAQSRPYEGVVASVILRQPIEIRIAPDRQGLRVDFSLAA